MAICEKQDESFKNARFARVIPPNQQVDASQLL
jgi:hypothetical protein